MTLRTIGDGKMRDELLSSESKLINVTLVSRSFTGSGVEQRDDAADDDDDEI